jgi:hypothetical protein
MKPVYRVILVLFVLTACAIIDVRGQDFPERTAADSPREKPNADSAYIGNFFQTYMLRLGFRSTDFYDRYSLILVRDQNELTLDQHLRVLRQGFGNSDAVVGWGFDYYDYLMPEYDRARIRMGIPPYGEYRSSRSLTLFPAKESLVPLPPRHMQRIKYHKSTERDGDSLQSSEMLLHK